jgi:alpha-L-rhamnosidase
VRAEHLGTAFPIGVTAPRLSWRISTEKPDWHQKAYEIRCGDQVVHVESRESILVPWPFAALRSRDRVEVQVRVCCHDGEWSDWSAGCSIEAGLLESVDWCADFIEPDWDEDSSRDQPPPYFRRKFTLDRRGVRRARLYATALGVYELHLNGALVAEDVLAPGWTSYHHRLRYQAYDVTDRLGAGTNVIGAIVGDGWFRGRLGFREQRNLYGDRVAFLAQLEIEFDDGSIEVVTTDANWRANAGPILASSLYDGEQHDARLELTGWSEPRYDDAQWSGVRLAPRPASALVAPNGPPVRRVELLDPVEILESPSGRPIIDFGQNLVGRLRIAVAGDRGRTITIRHAEVLEQGELCLRPLRDAAATDSYTLAGEGREVWEPRFTFHGFRYAEIDGWPGRLIAEAVQAVVIHSDLERTGWFSCSDELVERLHENVVWSMRGNFLDLPTDCPQRDERLGWTGDTQVFAPTATFLYDTAGFLTSWLADLSAEQRARDGRVPNVVPDVLPHRGKNERHNWHAPAAGWGDAAAIVPWVLYLRTGDIGLLAQQFESMKAWVEFVRAIVGPGHLWNTGFQFGDWLDPAAPPEHAERGRTSTSLVATAYYARSAEITANVAAVLGDTEAESRYRSLAEDVREAFSREYVLTDGRMASDSQTAYALALEFALVRDEERRRFAGRRLADLASANGFRIGSGFLGTPIICDALCNAGEFEVAYRLLLERSCPSWLYPVTMGATTIWERWDSLLPDGSVNPGEMTSFNHYAFGAVADWLHRTVAGLAPMAPGYRRIAISPRPGGGLTHASARHRTPYGIAESGWRILDGTLHVHATIPPNTTALVDLHGVEELRFEVGSGNHEWTLPDVPRFDTNGSLLASGAADLSDGPRR